VPEKLLNIKEVQEALGISESTIFRLMKSRKLQGFKVGREWRFQEKDIDAFIARQRQQAEREAPEEAIA
jgi:excisionase family DNA binding protein